MNTYLEDYIHGLYLSMGITQPEQLDILAIAKRLNVEINYRRSIFRLDNEIILTPGTKEEEWMNFGHEICHFLRHCGNQAILHPLFIELQEWQADNFAYQFCVPTFMLQRIRLPPYRREAVQLIAETFHVDCQFADERLTKYRQKLFV